jgi:type I restriction enzyme, R subunit
LLYQSSKISESSVEDLAIERLIDQGYSYLPGPEIAPDSATPMRGSFEDVLLLDQVRAAINRLNPHLPAQMHSAKSDVSMRLNSSPTTRPSTAC